MVGICLGEGALPLALGALLLFVSNLVSMVIAGTVLFAALGYSAEADQEARRVGAGRKSYVTLVALLVAVLVPLALNTALVLLLHSWTGRIQDVAETWLAGVPEADVTGVTFASSSFRIEVRVPPDDLPPTDALLRALDGQVPDGLSIVVDTTTAKRWMPARPARPDPGSAGAHPVPFAGRPTRGRPAESSRQLGTPGPVGRDAGAASVGAPHTDTKDAPP